MITWAKKEILFQSDRTIVCRIVQIEDGIAKDTYISKSLNLEYPKASDLAQFYHE